MGIVMEMKALGKHKQTPMQVAVLTKVLSVQGLSRSLVTCLQPQDSFVGEVPPWEPVFHGRFPITLGDEMKLPSEASRTHQLCLLILFSARRKLALRGSTDKGDLGKWLIWNLLEESEIGRISAFGRKKRLCVCVCVIYVPQCCLSLRHLESSSQGARAPSDWVWVGCKCCFFLGCYSVCWRDQNVELGKWNLLIIVAIYGIMHDSFYFKWSFSLA